MPMEGRTTCAVPECGARISSFSNLCTVHMVPGAIVRLGENTMIITSWLAQHGEEQGIIVLNDFALGDLFRGAGGFLEKLKEQGFVDVRLLRTPEELENAKKPAEGKEVGDWSGPWRTQYLWGVAKAPDRSGDPGLDDASNYFGDLPELSGQQNAEKPALTPAVTVPHDDPSDPKASRDDRVSELLVTIGDAILNCIGPMVAGTLKQRDPAELASITTGLTWLRITPAEVSRLLGPSPAEADLAAAVALFPAGVRALITARVDARVRVSRSVDKLEVSISQCNEPAFLFRELSEPYDATHALHLICDPAEDTGYTFVMIEFSAGKLSPSGWVDGESAARYAAEGAKSATGRPPDFQGTTSKLPK